MRFTLPRLQRKTIAIITLAIIILVPLQIYLWAHSMLPQQKGSVELEALSDDVEVVRDNYGVPHIFAPDWRSAYVALGYLHAQDRLWQMDLMRRAGAGRLSEVLGTATVKTDKLMRTLGLHTAARDSYYALNPDVQGALQAYAAGVNNFIQENDLPMEMRILGYEPDAWQPADSLVWLKLMAYQLGGQWRDEITAAQLANHITEEQIGTLLGWVAAQSTKQPLVVTPVPVTTQEEAPETPAVTKKPVKKPTAKKSSPRKKPTNQKKRQNKAEVDWQRLAESLPPHGPRSASNGWVVGGRFTADGMPQLANDPHLGLNTPVLWYLARIVTPDGSVTGATAPGMPFHILGQNDDMAWGITSTGADTSDLYIEHLKNPEQYITPNGAEAFTTRTEEIKVKNANRILLDVRVTRHGVVISDVEPDATITDDTNVVALGATFLRGDDTGAEALYWLNRAKTPSDIEQAVRFVQAPVQNLFFADKRGNYGMRVVGSVPVRAHTTGVMPVDGTTINGDWTGVIPRIDLPRFTNPVEGFIGNANEAVADENYPYLITRMWYQPYRGERLKDLLGKASATAVTLDIHAEIQNDIISVGATELRDTVLALLPEPTSGAEKEAYKILKTWQGDYAKKAKAPLILTYLQETLLTALLADELNSDVTILRPAKIGTLLRALRDDKTNWCNNVNTEATETCSIVVATAWHEAVKRIISNHSINSDSWMWESVNIAPLENKFWQQIPFVGGWIENATAVDGGDTTLKRAATEDAKPGQLFDVTHGAGYRGIYSAGNLDSARYVTATGQSSHIMSSNYADQTPLWAAGKNLSLTGTLGQLQEQYGRYLTLESGNKKR